MLKKSPLILSIILLTVAQSIAQNVPRYQKYSIGGGMQAYLPTEPVVAKFLSEDSSEIYTCKVTWQEFNFTVIAVKFGEPINDANDQQVMMEAYLDFTKKQIAITSSAGYGKGHTMESHPSAKGVIDFWEDEEKNQYQIKAWIDSKNLAVLMLYGQKEFPNFNVAQLFLNGFRFPEK